MSPPIRRGIDRLVKRSEPAIALFIADRGDDQQIARARRRDIGDPHAFGPFAPLLFRSLSINSQGAHRSKRVAQSLRSAST